MRIEFNLILRSLDDADLAALLEEPDAIEDYLDEDEDSKVFGVFEDYHEIGRASCRERV